MPQLRTLRQAGPSAFRSGLQARGYAMKILCGNLKDSDSIRFVAPDSRCTIDRTAFSFFGSSTEQRANLSVLTLLSPLFNYGPLCLNCDFSRPIASLLKALRLFSALN